MKLGILSFSSGSNQILWVLYWKCSLENSKVFDFHLAFDLEIPYRDKSSSSVSFIFTFTFTLTFDVLIISLFILITMVNKDSL